VNRNDVMNNILGIFRQKEFMSNIHEDQDFFEIGVSSLTIVEMQIFVEKSLGVETKTSNLMAAPTISGWVDIYYDLVSTGAFSKSKNCA